MGSWNSRSKTVSEEPLEVKYIRSKTAEREIVQQLRNLQIRSSTPPSSPPWVLSTNTQVAHQDSRTHHYRPNIIRRNVSPPILVRVNSEIIKTTPTALYFSRLMPSSFEYNKIKNMITNRNIIVDKIEKINNILLEKAFDLKKEEKLSRFDNVEEQLLFHGTKHINVMNICTFNFDWRLRGTSTGHRYGQGISFSPNAKYASNYSDTTRTDKVIIIAKVLVAAACQGKANMIVPPSGYDTTQKGTGIVTVKYEDSEYCPAYVLYYHFQTEETIATNCHKRHVNRMVYPAFLFDD